MRSRIGELALSRSLLCLKLLGHMDGRGDKPHGGDGYSSE